MIDQKSKHILLDVKFEKYPVELEKVDFWKGIGASVLKKGKFSILKEHFHSFSPQGLSGFWLLSESHLSVHTWPEVGHVFLDLFSCGDSRNTEKAVDCLISEMEKIGGEIVIKEDFERGFVFCSEEEKQK